MLTIDLQWFPPSEKVAGHQVGYDVGEMSVPLTALQTPENTLTVQIDLSSRQLHRFWVMAYDTAGNIGKKVYIKNAYRA